MSNAHKSPLSLYHSCLQAGTLSPDPEQDKAVRALTHLYDTLTMPSAFFAFAVRRKSVPGVYLHGGVGRGKSMLMDLFMEALPSDFQPRRVHFHAFMIEVHSFLHDARLTGKDVNNALPRLARQIAKRHKVLCFDEFHVTDIADAMLLGRLFTHLFQAKLTIVATSNWDPERLYEGGLQRDLFLPFIALLQDNMHVVHLDSPYDYRAQFDPTGGTYFYPLTPATHTQARDAFDAVTQRQAPHPFTLHITGRTLEIPYATECGARIGFHSLCARPLGAQDYLVLAERFSWVWIEDIPVLGPADRNEAKRFMTLVDALYEAKSKVIFTAEAPPEDLYHGNDHGYEFERTISRLNEMRTPAYWEAY